MKYIINYSLLLIAFLLIITGCYKNPNWKIFSEIPPGVYIQGDATVVSQENRTNTFKVAVLDGHDPISSIQEKYVWLKKNGTFTITIVDNNIQTTLYGQGNNVVTDSRYTTYELVANGAGFTIPEDGLYCLEVATQLKQITIIPVKWGLIGAATPGGWSTETPLVIETPYDPATNEVVLKVASANMTKAEYKFRYSGNWGIEIPYDETGSKVKTHTDLTSKDALTESYTPLIIASNNIALAQGGNYEFGIKFNVATSTFSAYAKLLGAPTVPQPPTELYLIGDALGGWDWGTNGITMVPTNNANVFWAIVWMNGTGGFKMSPEKGWGKDFGEGSSPSIVSTESVYLKGGNNIPSPTIAGYYMITYKFNADGAYNDSISIKPAEREYISIY